MLYSDIETGDDGEMGPGMDLVISMLAFVVMLLAILAIERNLRSKADPVPDPADIAEPSGQIGTELSDMTARLGAALSALDDATVERDEAQADAANLQATVEQRDQDVARLQAIIDATQTGNDTTIGKLAGDLATTQEELQEKTAQAQALTQEGIALQEALVGSRAQTRSAQVDLRDAEAALVAAKEEGGLLGSQLVTATARIAQLVTEVDGLNGTIAQLTTDHALAMETQIAANLVLQEENERLQAALPDPDTPDVQNNVPIVLSDTANLRIFEAGSAKLTAQGEDRLERIVQRILRAVRRDADVNTLRIAGYASPESYGGQAPYGNLDGNLRLSTDRALTIAHELGVLGVPLHCIVIEGLGRGRSVVGQQVTDNLNQFDRRLSALPQSQQDALVQQFPGERRVEVLTTVEPDSQCSNRTLRRRFRQIAESLDGG